MPAPARETPPTLTGSVERVRTGAVAVRRWSGREILTGAHKTVRTDAVAAGVLGLDGDAQGNPKVHGGPDKAICCYPAEHYAAWAADGRPIGEDGFFENLTLRGLVEADVHLGDVLRVGTAVVEVTQPRRPCTTVSARWGDRLLPRLMQETGRCGYYLRVLEPGEISAGDAAVLESRAERSVSVAEANRVMNVDRTELAGIERLLAAPELPERWRRDLMRRRAGVVTDESERLGPSR